MSFLIRQLCVNKKFTDIGQITNAFRSLSLNNNVLSSPVDRKKHFKFTVKREIKQDNPVVTVDNKEALQNVNELLKTKSEGRLFAVIHLCGKQFKITAGDIIIVEGYWPPTIGDKIRLEKVLLVAGKDFSLIGSPMLKQGLVDVQATIIEKTLSHIKTHFRKKRRKQYMRINFNRIPRAMIRVNSIEIKEELSDSDKKPFELLVFKKAEKCRAEQVMITNKNSFDNYK